MSNIDNNKIEQEDYQKCFVCYLDVLGFKELVESHPAKDLHIMLDHLRSDIKILCQKSSVQWLFISDSLLLFTPDEPKENFDRLSSIIAAIIPMAFSNNFPIRGAISHGDFYFDNESGFFFGPAYLDAEKYERKQEWAGVILTPNCTNFVMSHNYNSGAKLLVEYNVPMKDGVLVKDDKCEMSCKNEKMFCINWTENYSIDKTIDETLLEVDFTSLRNKVRKEDLNKIENTRKFMNHCNQLGKNEAEGSAFKVHLT